MIGMKWPLVVIIAGCNTVGDVLNAAGMKRQPEVEDFTPHSLAGTSKRIISNPLVLGGFVALAAAFFSLVLLLSIADVSFAIPATGVSFAFETLLSKYLLKEKVGLRRWPAATLVACGVMLLQW